MTEKLKTQSSKEFRSNSWLILLTTVMLGILALLNKTKDKQIGKLCGQDRTQCTEINLEPFCYMGTCFPQSEWTINKP